MADAPPLVLAAALLDALEPLPHVGRMSELAAGAGRLADQRALRAVLDELEDGDPYERRIAVIAAAVGRDAEWIGARLADEDAVVRGHALRAARTLGVPDTAYERAFADAPAAVRRHLVRAIVADRLVLAERETHGDIEAARLLPGCSATTVRTLLPELRRSTACWSSLGHHHPGPVLDSAEEELAGLPAVARDAWWHGYGHPRGIAAATRALPHRVLDLLERFGPTRFPVVLGAPLGRLVAADPVRLARLAIRPDVCARLLHVLSGTRLCRLVRALPDTLLVELARTLSLRAGPDNRAASAVLAAAGRTPAAHRDLVPDAVALLARSLDLTAHPDTLHTRLVALAAPHTSRPALAATTARTVGRRVAGQRGAEAADPGTGTLLLVVARLAGTGDPAEGLLAAELTVACGLRTGWTGPWRTQLRMLRQHSSDDVPDVAYAGVTAEE